MALLDDLRVTYPWLDIIGLGNYVIELVRDGATIDESIAKVRATPQYKARFPGILAADGRRRFATEAEYLREEQSYRQVLIDFGAFDPNQDKPQDYMAFLDNSILPEQLKQRFAVYRALERGSQEVRDAFYIYGGLEVSVDDLYQATVSPEFRQRMISTYDETVAKSPLNYTTFLTRATQRGLTRVTETLQNMQKLGMVTGDVISRMLSIDPNFAREMMGALFQSSGPDTKTLGVDELLSAFDAAMIGSAATKSGFALPDKARIEEYRTAGVDRARALRAYSEMELRQGGLSAMASRFNRPTLDQKRLESAFVLGEATATADVSRLFELENALGKAGEGFARAAEGSRVLQQGRSRY